MLSVAGTPCIASNFSRVQNSTQRKRIHTSRLEQSLTDSEVPYKNPAYLYWSANEQLALQRLSRSFSQVYQSVCIHACQCVYANAARGSTLRRVSHCTDMWAGNAGTSDLVGMPAMRDLGSLHSSPLYGKRN